MESGTNNMTLTSVNKQFCFRVWFLFLYKVCYCSLFHPFHHYWFCFCSAFFDELIYFLCIWFLAGSILFAGFSLLTLLMFSLLFLFPWCIRPRLCCTPTHLRQYKASSVQRYLQETGMRHAMSSRCTKLWWSTCRSSQSCQCFWPHSQSAAQI